MVIGYVFLFMKIEINDYHFFYVHFGYIQVHSLFFFGAVYGAFEHLV